MTERLGILGGTFDPVHAAHIVAAVQARYQLRLDRVLLVVANDPWQKRDRVVVPPRIRHEMVMLAIAGIDGLEASTVEIDREGPSYTIDTVEQLAPAGDLVLILGSDAARGIDTWHRAEELRNRVTLAIVGRADERSDAPAGWDAVQVDMPRLDISSSDLRDRIGRGEPIDGLVPPEAVRIIHERRLYTSP